MGREHERDALPGDERDAVEHGVRCVGVELRGRFVRHDERGPRRQRLRDRRTLLLTARQLTGQTPEVTRDAERVSHRHHRVVVAPARTRGQPQVLSHREVFHEVVRGPLEHVPDRRMPYGAAAPSRGAADLEPHHRDGTPRRAIEPRDESQQR